MSYFLLKWMVNIGIGFIGVLICISIFEIGNAYVIAHNKGKTVIVDWASILKTRIFLILAILLFVIPCYVYREVKTENINMIFSNIEKSVDTRTSTTVYNVITEKGSFEVSDDVLEFAKIGSENRITGVYFNNQLDDAKMIITQDTADSFKKSKLLLKED